MRVVLDANVFVSSMLSTQGNPKRIVSAWQQGDFDVVMSGPILDEIGRVLRYPRIVKRHKQDEAAIARYLELLANMAIVVDPAQTVTLIKEGESDNRYLECAVAGKAHYVVSGDRHVLAVGEFKGILTLSPAAFVALLAGGGIA